MWRLKLKKIPIPITRENSCTSYFFYYSETKAISLSFLDRRYKKCVSLQQQLQKVKTGTLYFSRKLDKLLKEQKISIL